MPALSSFPLDDDITDRILTCLPDFSSLQSAIVAFKSIHAVFVMHPKSIIRAVAYNVVGPTLPQALKLARCQLRHSSNIPPANDLKPDDILNGEDVSHPIEAEEIRRLIRNARVVNTLEDMFSRSHKDRSSSTSQLSLVESLRFRRAMYRLWLFSNTFSGEDITGEEEQEDIDGARQARKAFLDVFSTEELRQFHMIVGFMKEVYGWIAPASWSTDDELALSFGPEVILQCYEEQSTSPTELFMGDHDLLSIDDILGDYVSPQLSQIWEERKVDGPPAGAYKTIILDEICGENDRCCRCDTVYGVDLWSESDWSFLRKGHLPPEELISGLKGRLPGNTIETSPLRNTFLSNVFSFADFMHEMYDVKIAPYDDWNKQDAFCKACLMDVIKWHLHLWWRERKRKEGQQIYGDCWYGYNCRTQVHKVDHARKLNHLCEPLRGDV